MNKALLIERILRTMAELPEDKANEIADFAAFIKSRFEEDSLSSGLQQLVSESGSYSYLNEEEDIYSLEDCKEIYR